MPPQKPPTIFIKRVKRVAFGFKEFRHFRRSESSACYAAHPKPMDLLPSNSLPQPRSASSPYSGPQSQPVLT